MDLQGATDGSALIGSGVYALIFAEEVVYVGKAKKLLTRIYSHRSVWERAMKGTKLPRNVKPMRFSGFQFWACEVSDLDRLEREKIAKYRPKYNERLKPKLEGKLGLPPGFLAKMLENQARVPEGFRRRV